MLVNVSPSAIPVESAALARLTVIALVALLKSAVSTPLPPSTISAPSPVMITSLPSPPIIVSAFAEP